MNAHQKPRFFVHVCHYMHTKSSFLVHVAMYMHRKMPFCLHVGELLNEIAAKPNHAMGQQRMGYAW